MVATYFSTPNSFCIFKMLKSGEELWVEREEIIS